MKLNAKLTFTMNFNDEMDTESSVVELLKSGDIKMEDFKLELLDEDGDDIMCEDAGEEIGQSVVMSLIGEGAE